MVTFVPCAYVDGMDYRVSRLRVVGLSSLDRWTVYSDRRFDDVMSIYTRNWIEFSSFRGSRL